MGIEELFDAIARGGTPAERIDSYDALGRHVGDDRAWERLVRGLEEDPDPDVADFLIKAALRPFKARHGALVERLVQAFAADPAGLASSRLIAACARWIKTLPSPVLSSVPADLRARLGWDAAPPRPPVSERLSAALDALEANEPEAFVRWRARDVPTTTDGRKRLLDGIERRLVRLSADGAAPLRLLAVETLERLGASRALLRDLARDLPRTSGLVDLVEDAPLDGVEPARDLGWGSIETIAGTPWLIGPRVTRLSSPDEGPQYEGDIWSVGRPISTPDGRTLCPIVERVDTRAKHASPTLRLTFLRIADDGVKIESSAPLEGAPSLASVADRVLVGGRGLRCFEASGEARSLRGFDASKEMFVHQVEGASDGAFASDGAHLFCVDLETGAERWRANVVPARHVTTALAIARDVVYIQTSEAVVLVDAGTGATLDVVAIDFGSGLLVADGEVWSWDGASCLGEAIVSGLSLGARRWLVASSLSRSVARDVDGTTVLFSPSAARWEGGGARFVCSPSNGIDGVGRPVGASIPLGARGVRPMPWAWFDLRRTRSFPRRALT